jgi:beta-lactamase class A
MTPDWSTLEALAREAEAAGGVIGFAVRGTDGELFSHNGDRQFRAASTIKIPILIEAYRQIESGTIDPEDRYALQDEDRVPGSGVLAHLHAGVELTFADLLILMIVISDNTATNLVIDRVGFDAVNETIRSLGMTGSVLGRKMLGHLPGEGDPENWVTPGDLALAVGAIVSGEAAGPESCAAMMETLAYQEDFRRITRFLPDDGSVRWGTKPGDLPGVVNDAGYVTTETGTASLAFCTEDLPDLDAAERAIGLIARESLALTGVVSLGASPSGAP